MKLKSYFSETVGAAMELARTELGEDALLVNARPASPESRYLGDYEVVFGVVEVASNNSSLAPAPYVQQEGPETESRRVGAALAAHAGMGIHPLQSGRTPGLPLSGAQPIPVPQLESSGKVSTSFGGNEMSQQIEDLRREVTLLAASFGGSTTQRIALPPTAALPVHSHDLEGREYAPNVLLKKLLCEELDPDLARRVADGTPLASILSVSPQLGLAGSSCAMVALVGPPGVGKTTTLIKLAIIYGLASQRTTHLITTDIHRIAAADQLRSLASVVGIECDIAETTHALEQLLSTHCGKDLILVDTPGFTPAALADREGIELAEYLATHGGIDTHLVLSAAAKPADMTPVVDRYSVFHPNKLIFTRIDETAHCGAIVSESVRTGLPISFLTNGQRIPEDLEEASTQRLVELIQGPDHQESDRPKKEKSRAQGMGAA